MNTMIRTLIVLCIGVLAASALTDGPSFSVSVQHDNGSYPAKVSSLEELKDYLKRHSVPDNVSLCASTQGSDDDFCKYKNIGYSNMTEAQFRWLTEDAKYELRYIRARYYE